MSDQQEEFEKLKASMQAVIGDWGKVAADAIQQLNPFFVRPLAEATEHQDQPSAVSGANQIKRLQDALNERDWVIRDLRSRTDLNSGTIKRLDRASTDLERELRRVTEENQFHMDQVENLGQTLTERDTQIEELRGTVQERDRVIQNQRNQIATLQVEAEVRNCSEPYRQTNVELQEQIRRLTERGDHDRTQLQEELSGAWEMNRNLVSELDARKKLVDLLTEALSDIGTVITKVANRLPANADEWED